MSMGNVSNYRSMNGIISYDDGAGGVLENGILNADHSDTTTSDVDNIAVENELKLNGVLYVDSTSVTPTWLSYLYGLTGNIQNQFDTFASTLLSSNNIWTGSQTLRNGVVNLIFQNTSSSYPPRSSSYIGAIYGTIRNSVALTFLNSNSNLDFEKKCFVWEKMDSSSTSVELMNLQNNGTLRLFYGGVNCDGGIVSPTITSINSSISTLNSNVATNTSDIAINASDISQNTFDIATNTLDISQNAYDITRKEGIINSSNRVNAGYIATGVVSNTEFNYLNGVTSSIQTQINAIPVFSEAVAYTFSALQTFASNIRVSVGSRLEIVGSTVANTLPSIGTSSTWLYTQGGSTYGHALSLVNAFANNDDGVFAFVFTKRATVNLDVMTISNDSVVTANSFKTRLVNQSSVKYLTSGSTVTYTFDTLPQFVYKTVNSTLRLPDPGVSVLMPHDGKSVYIYHYNNNVSTRVECVSGTLRSGDGNVDYVILNGPPCYSRMLAVLNNQWCLIDT